LDTLENDHANFRAALEYAKEHQTGDAFPSRLAAALWRFWQIRGHYADGRAALASALSEESNAATAERTILLLGAGTLAYEQGDSEIAEESFTAGLLAAKVNGDRLIEAKIRTTFGLIRLRQGRYTEARTTVETALALFRECGDQRGESAALTNLGLSYFREGRFAEARPYYEATLTIYRALQDWRGVAQMQNNLGNLAACTGQYDEARRCHEESLALKRSLGDQAGIVSSLNNLGIVAMYQGCLDEARALQQEALRLRLHLGLRHGIRESLINVAAIACRTGEYERAVCLWGAAEAMDSALDIPTTAPAEASEEARARRDALQALGQGRYAAALQRGRCLSPESAAAVALQPSRSSLL
jgi:tetratricopeptide (TPR) repeat protein